MDIVVTKELARLIEEVETDSIYSRLSRIEKMEHNPMGVAIRKYGNATIFTVKNIPGPTFNKIKGMMDDDLSFLKDIIEFFDQKGIPARFELTPAHATSVLYSALANQGYFHNGFSTNLFADPKKIPKKEYPSISIREFEVHEFDLFADLYVDAFEMPTFLKESIAHNNKVLHGISGWKFYLANYENKPAGIGVLFMGEKGGYLAAAGTIPLFRNKGVQGALIQHRIKVAKKNKCKLIVGQANFGSVSQNNIERAGLKIAYTKSIWTQLSK